MSIEPNAWVYTMCMCDTYREANTYSGRPLCYLTGEEHDMYWPYSFVRHKFTTAFRCWISFSPRLSHGHFMGPLRGFCHRRYKAAFQQNHWQDMSLVERIVALRTICISRNKWSVVQRWSGSRHFGFLSSSAFNCRRTRCIVATWKRERLSAMELRLIRLDPFDSPPSILSTVPSLQNVHSPGTYSKLNSLIR